MPKFVGIPAVALELVAEGGVSYIVEEGTSFESISVEHPFEEVTVAGTVVAIELAARQDNGHHGRIFDGIPTHHFEPDDMGNIKNASDYFVGNRIAIEREDGTIAIVPVDKIKAISGTVTDPAGFSTTAVASVEDLVNAIAVGGTVIMTENVDAPTATVVTVDTDLDLNGKEISISEDTVGDGVFKVTNGTMYIGGEGTINGVGKNDWNMAIWATENGKVVITGGLFTNEGATANVDPAHFDLIYASGNGQIEILGGEFKCQTPAWILNVKDADRATASIVVKGGVFHGFDPANCASEGANTSFVAEGYKSVEKEPGVFEVVVDDGAADEVVPEETPAE